MKVILTEKIAGHRKLGEIVVANAVKQARHLALLAFTSR